jgi:ATP-dependent RNA circularization protein (DNA/RNA ligase family)
MPCTCQFQHGLDSVPGVRRIEERETVKATESDEVESFRFLEPLQIVRHGSIIVGTAIRPEDPLIAMKPR